MPRFDRSLFRNSIRDEAQWIEIPRRHQPPLRLKAKAIGRSRSQKIGPLADFISG